MEGKLEKGSLSAKEAPKPVREYLVNCHEITGILIEEGYRKKVREDQIEGRASEIPEGNENQIELEGDRETVNMASSASDGREPRSSRGFKGRKYSKSRACRLAANGLEPGARAIRVSCRTTSKGLGLTFGPGSQNIQQES